MRREFVLIVLTVAVGVELKGCDYFQMLKPQKLYAIASHRKSQNSNCRWTAEAPPGYKIFLACNEVKLSPSLLCREEKILVSVNGQEDLRKRKAHCGSSPFVETTLGTKISIALQSKSGKLKCSLKAIPGSCVCGQLNRGRIGEYVK